MTKSSCQFKNYLNRGKIRTQLLTVYLFAGILPIMVVGGYLLVNNNRLVLRQHSELTSAYNIRSKSVMLDITTAVSKISDEIFADDALQRLLATEYKNSDEVHDACRSYTTLDNYAQNYVEVSNIAVYTDNPTMIDYGHLKTTTGEDLKSAWYRTAAASFAPHWMIWSYSDKYGNRIIQLRLVRKIPVIRTGGIAVLVIDVNNNHLKSRIETDLMDSVLSVNGDPTFFSSIPGCLGQPLKVPFELDRNFSFIGPEIARFNGDSELLEVSSLTPVNSSDRIYIATVDDGAVPNMRSMMVNCGLIVLFSLLVPLVMIIFFTRTFSGRVNTLRREMHKVGQGQYDIIESFSGNDELVDVFSDLKTMIENIKSRDEEIYRDRIVKQQMINQQQKIEFKMLSSQINPHFLYNTLETIRMKAYVVGDFEVANAIKLLGKSMRHFLESSGSAVSLESELEYVRIYLEIQKIRFRDKFDYVFRIDENVDCREYKIIPLLLQPIAENAMVHGLEEKDGGGLIEIGVRAEDGEKLLFWVSDNGCGMSREALEELEKKINAPKEKLSGGIGLYNVQRRIKMFYGENYGIEIFSGPDAGTRVTVTLPLRWKEVEYESSDC